MMPKRTAAAVFPLAALAVIGAAGPAGASTGTTYVIQDAGVVATINAAAQGASCHALGSIAWNATRVNNQSTGTFYIYSGFSCTGSYRTYNPGDDHDINGIGGNVRSYRYAG